jgi:hypothetical protein
MPPAQFVPAIRDANAKSGQRRQLFPARNGLPFPLICHMDPATQMVPLGVASDFSGRTPITQLRAKYIPIQPSWTCHTRFGLVFEKYA